MRYFNLQLDEVKLKECRPRFAETDEGHLIDMWLLRYRLIHELRELEIRLSDDHATELDEQWAAMVVPFEKEGERLLTQLKGSAYESEAEQIYQEYLGDRLVAIRPEVVNTATGEVCIKVFGILSKPNKLQRSGGITIGELPKGIVRKTFTDRLSKVNNYAYSLEEGKSRAHLRYELLKVYTYDLENYCKQIEVLDRATGAPVPNVRIDLMDGDRKVFTTMATDSEGRALLQSRPNYYWAVVKDPRLITEEQVYISELPRTQKQRETKVTRFYTDRPIYRRGQEVKVGTITAKYKGALVSLIVTRPLVKRFKKRNKVMGTNADRHIGQVGFMLTDLTDIDETAQAKVGAETWTVKSDKAPLLKGTKVKVLAIEGVKLIVEPVTE